MDALKFAEDLDAVLAAIEDKKRRSVSDGSASDWADYKARCAYIKAIEEARGEVRKLAATRNDEEDDD